jgi:hypothetical protein
VSKVNLGCGKTRGKGDFMHSQDAKTTENFQNWVVARGRGNRTDGLVAQSLVQMPRYTVFGRVESESWTRKRTC